MKNTDFKIADFETITNAYANSIDNYDNRAAVASGEKTAAEIITYDKFDWFCGDYDFSPLTHEEEDALLDKLANWYYTNEMVLIKELEAAAA